MRRIGKILLYLLVSLVVLSITVDVNAAKATIKYEKSSNNYLSNIVLSEGELEFDPEKTSYNVEVPYRVKEVKVQGVVSDGRSTLVGDGVKELQYGNNNIILSVVAENGAKREYAVVINRLERTKHVVESSAVKMNKIFIVVYVLLIGLFGYLVYLYVKKLLKDH